LISAIPLGCGSLTTTDADDMHPFASCTITVYVPAASPLKVDEPWKVTPSIENKYGGFPPFGKTEMLPSDPPKTVTSVEVAFTVKAVGCVITTVTVDEQPFAEVTFPI
jgi:hypothetical protein